MKETGAGITGGVNDFRIVQRQEEFVLFEFGEGVNEWG